jgi:hypothetical protein
MSDYNWCHGPLCHTNQTQDRVRGTKGNKVLRTRKIKRNSWWGANSSWHWFCSHHCQQDFWNKYGAQIRAIAPRNEPLETPINVTTKTYTNWRGDEYQAKEIETINNNEGETMSQN